MAKQWIVHPHDAGKIADLQRAAGVPAVVAQLLISRGIEHPAAAKQFLDPKLSGLRDPEELPGAGLAATRITESIERRDRIVIYGDYDADGMTAAALLYRCLSMLGADVGYYVPNRMEEGYGLNREALATLAGRGTRLVVTVDCGITSVDEACAARELGIDLIVTDHHQPGAALPDVCAIVHPGLAGGGYPFPGLCGAGVALKLAWAVCQRAAGAKRVGERMKNFLLEAVGLAALGTVADVVPLVDENRILVKHGLVSLHQRPCIGIAALLAVTELNRQPALSAEDVAFSLAPRLNAAGRLGQAQLAVELLTTDRPERATALAEYIHELNKSRQSLERSVYLAAHKQAQSHCDLERDPALVLEGHDWHPGVIGIVAGKLAEKYHRPVVIISLDKLGTRPATGSARSVPGFALNEALCECSETLLGHGGHAAAAGLTIEECNVEAFRRAFCELAASEAGNGASQASLRIDAETPLSGLTMQAIGQMERLAPFGAANARPVLCTGDVKLVEPPKRMGDTGRHVSFRFRQHDVTMRAVAFGQGDWADELTGVDGSLAIAYRPVINTFGGRSRVELHLDDWKPA
jgi:single-stranded-DNA-specific exonuclease